VKQLCYLTYKELTLEEANRFIIPVNMCYLTYKELTRSSFLLFIQFIERITESECYLTYKELTQKPNSVWRGIHHGATLPIRN
jgi:hypothetical protein